MQYHIMSDIILTDNGGTDSSRSGGLTPSTMNAKQRSQPQSCDGSHEREMNGFPSSSNYSDKDNDPTTIFQSPLKLPPSIPPTPPSQALSSISSRGHSRSPAAAYFRFECVEESAAASLGGVLCSVFSTFAAVEEVCIKSSFVDAGTARLRGSGFVHFANDEAGRAAVLAASRELKRSERLGVLVSVEVSNTFRRYKEGADRLQQPRFGFQHDHGNHNGRPWYQRQYRGSYTTGRYSEGPSRYHSNSHSRSQPHPYPYPFSYSYSAPRSNQGFWASGYRSGHCPGPADWIASAEAVSTVDNTEWWPYSNWNSYSYRGGSGELESAAVGAPSQPSQLTAPLQGQEKAYATIYPGYRLLVPQGGINNDDTEVVDQCTYGHGVGGAGYNYRSTQPRTFRS